MYLRFTTTLIDSDSRKPEGVFAAAYRLLDSPVLDPAERRAIRDLLYWFNENLPEPPEAFVASRAIFWFRASAKECIQKMWSLASLVEAHGYHITVHRCPHLANICFRDNLQVAAYPSSSDGKIMTR